ncbi:DciA family protein [Streptomyces sp. D54]|uniref:DciA family protein n=1 Tax=Streptomyces sp. D54 TaxID=1290289 RepID=UPI003CF4E1EB
MMMTERGMAAPAAGGSVLARFDTILTAVVPELARRVKAVAFDAETGHLDVAPDLPAAGTQLRWSAPKLIAAANEKVAGANVRALRVAYVG